MIGQTISHYKILEKLGEGGMGVVYKAEDTKLDRLVALKFLPERLNASEQDKARFIQEAKAASAINHPNICTIHSIEEHDGQLFIVMEFVDGETLRKKEPSIGFKQAIDIGIQIADGLAAAHEKGIVHRDIKPENIMIRKDGIAQVMDFGLAKLRASGSKITRLTKEGSTVGTAGYMSPEQVQGQETDQRSDIFSYGVLLYELLTGQLPFKGVHETAVAYEIVNVDPPPMSVVKPEIDPNLDAVVFECLEKDVNERAQSIKQISVDLKRYKRESSRSRMSRTTSAYKADPSLRESKIAEVSPGTFTSRVTGYFAKNKIQSAVILLLAGALLFTIWKESNTSSSSFTEPVQFSFDIPGRSGPILHWEYVLQISPDGKSIAFTDFSGSSSVIDIRNLDNSIPYPVRGTEGGNDPSFLNNNWISFGKGSYLRMKIPLEGGVPDISDMIAINGISLGANGEIIFAKSWPSGLTFKSGWNEKEEELTKIDASQNEGCHLLPYILPGDKAAVFTIWSKDGTFDDSKIAVVNLKTKERKNLNYNGVELHGTSPRFIQTSAGNYLLWTRTGNLFASSFDLSDLKVTGPEIKILDGIAVNASSGKAGYTVTDANNGTIAFIPGTLDTAKDDLVWIDKNGIERKAVSSSGPYMMPMIGNNGKGVVILSGAVYKIGLIDFEKNSVDLLFANGDNDLPKITPDGSNFVFVSNFEDGKYNIYLSRLDGIGGAKKIIATEGGYPEISNLSPDGKYILFASTGDTTKIWMKDITNNQQPELLIHSGASMTSPEFSPDGKFIAYRSDEIDGKFKLFIRPFPINDVKIQVSIDDGNYPQWSADGSEIFYRDNDRIMAARIQLNPALQVVSRRLVCTSVRVSESPVTTDFSVAPDGRILLLKSATDQSKPVQVKVIVNWFSELKKKLTNQN